MYNSLDNFIKNFILLGRLHSNQTFPISIHNTLYLMQDNSKPAEDLANKIKAALGKHAEKEEEGEAEEGSDMDMDTIPDEEMAKLDQKLAEAFKALGGNKTGTEKKRELLSSLAKQHFRLREVEESLGAEFDIVNLCPEYC